MNESSAASSIKPTNTKKPVNVGVAIVAGLGAATALVVRYLGDVAGVYTVGTIWVLLGVTIFITLPLQFFPSKSDETAVSGDSRKQRNRQKLPWFVRLVLTVLLTPIILGSLSIRRTRKENEPDANPS